VAHAMERDGSIPLIASSIFPSGAFLFRIRQIQYATTAWNLWFARCSGDYDAALAPLQQCRVGAIHKFTRGGDFHAEQWREF
jgi:hypothetical protein